MRTKKEINMRTTVLIVLLLSSAASQLLAQTPATPPEIAQISASKSMPIPKYLAYRHFLAWVSDLDSKAVAAGESDPYKFAEPFQRAQLEPQDLDALRKEAKALDSELTKHDQKVKAVIAQYRKTAQHAVEHGLALPAAPAEMHELQAMRTAILVQHMVNLQSALGPQKSKQLDAYLDREFVPHMSLKPLARPAARTVSGIPRQPFTIGQQ
jgi:hypothetical protein